MEVIAGYKQTKVGVIPEDWEVKHLGELGSVVRGGSPRPAGDPRYFNGNFIPWLTVAALTNTPEHCLNITETLGFLTEEGAKRSRLLQDGTFILANSGATLGVAKLLGITCCANDGIAAIVSQHSGDKRFLCHYVNSRTKELREVVATGNGQPNLNTGLIRGITIPFPPLPEQRAIATALSDVDALLDGLTRLIAKKRDLKQATVQQLLTGQTRLPGFNGGWHVKRLGVVADVIDPHPSHRAPDVVANGVPFVGIGDLDESGNIVGTKLRLVDASVLDEHALRYSLNDELVGLGRVASIGKVVALKKHLDGYAISPTLGLIRGREAKRAYLLYALKSKFVTEQFTKIMSGSTRSSVGMEVLRELQIELPPTEEEQTAIASVLSDMDAELAALDARLTKIRALKQAMMSELLSGKTRLLTS